MQSMATIVDPHAGEIETACVAADGGLPFDQTNLGIAPCGQAIRRTDARRAGTQDHHPRPRFQNGHDCSFPIQILSGRADGPYSLR
jgi:hypothetical protein